MVVIMDYSSGEIDLMSGYHHIRIGKATNGRQHSRLMKDCMSDWLCFWTRKCA